MQDGVYNARIGRVEISREDRGVLSIWVHLEYAAAGQGFGGYTVYHPDHTDDTGRWVWGILDVAGVDKLNDAVGQPVRAIVGGGLVRGLMHFLDDNITFRARREE